MAKIKFPVIFFFTITSFSTNQIAPTCRHLSRITSLRHFRPIRSLEFAPHRKWLRIGLFTLLIFYVFIYLLYFLSAAVSNFRPNGPFRNFSIILIVLQRPKSHWRFHFRTSGPSFSCFSHRKTWTYKISASTDLFEIFPLFLEGQKQVPDFISGLPDHDFRIPHTKKLTNTKFQTKWTNS